MTNIFDCYDKKLIANMNFNNADSYDYEKRKAEGRLTKEQALKLWADSGKHEIIKYCEAHPTCNGCSYRKEHIGCEFRGKSPREWGN